MPLIVAPNLSANTYVGESDADAYHATRLHNGLWTALTAQQKDAVLQWSTRLLDSLKWRGDKNNNLDNALRFPRLNLIDMDGAAIDDSVVPQFLKNATAELAFYLAESDTTKTDDAQYSSIKVGPITLNTNTETNKNKNPVPDNVMDMVRPWLTSINFGVVRG